MPDNEVLIVGGGPAGLSTAIELLEHDPYATVTVLEGYARTNRLDPALPGGGHSMCSGGLGRHMLNLIGWDLPKSIIMADINRATVQSRREVVSLHADDLGLNGPIGLVLDRKKLDDWLVGRAIKAGAHYVPGARVSRVGPGSTRGSSNATTPRFVAVTKAGDEFAGDVLVGADGPESLVASTLFAPPPIRDEDMFLASEVYVPRSMFPADEILLHFQPDRLQGYYWAFSAGDSVKVGCGTTRASKLLPNEETEWWRGKLRDDYQDPWFTAHPTEHVGGRITGAPPLRYVVNDAQTAALAGEAARAVWASIGAGDASAIETGRRLGRAIAEDDLWGYQTWWSWDVEPLLRRHYRIKQLLLSFTDREMDKAIRAVRGYRPKTVNSRKEIPRLIGHLALHSPGIMSRAAWRALRASV